MKKYRFDISDFKTPPGLVKTDDPVFSFPNIYGISRDLRLSGNSNRILLLIFILVILLQDSCKVSYSFTGAAISPDVKTISIPYITNNASLVVPTLSRTMTDALRDYFTSQTSLQTVDRNGDLELTGNITAYTVTPVAIQGNETAAMNRLTITVNVKFINKKNTTQKFERPFSRYQDYPVQDLNTVQDGLIKTITDQLVQDIFNASVVNW